MPFQGFVTGFFRQPGQGPKLILPVRRSTEFHADLSGIAELTRPAVERSEPVVPSGEFEFRTPGEVVKGLGLGYDAERDLERAVRKWVAEADVIQFRKSLYASLRQFSRDYQVRNEIARRAQSLWKATRGSAISRRFGFEGQPQDIVQKASQLGLFGSISKPPPRQVGGGSVGQRLAEQAAERQRQAAAPSPAERQAAREESKKRGEAKLEAMRAKHAAPAPAPAVANKPPAGFTPIPNSTRGGYHKRVGAKFVYWYPDTGIVERPHAEEAPAVHQMHDIVHAALGGFQAEVTPRPKPAPAPAPAPVQAPPPAAPAPAAPTIAQQMTEQLRARQAAEREAENVRAAAELQAAAKRQDEAAAAYQAKMAQQAQQPATPTRQVIVDKPPPGGWRPEDKVPPRKPAVPPPPPPQAFRDVPKKPEGPKLVVPTGKTLGDLQGEARLGWQKFLAKMGLPEGVGITRYMTLAQARAHAAAAGQTPQAVTPSKQEGKEHGPATPGTAAEGGASHRRVVDAPARGTGQAREGAGGASPQARPEGGTAGVIERLTELGSHPPATETTGELGVDTREVPKPTPEERKTAITVAEKYLPPIRKPLPDSAFEFPVPGPITNSRGEVVDYIRRLYPHQKEGAERILQAWEQRDGIILQDDAGLGKTNTALAALVAHGGARNLVVVPTTNKEGLKTQWAGPLAAGLYGIEFHAQSDVYEGKGKDKKLAVKAGLSADRPGYYIVSYDELTVPVIDPETGKQKMQPGPINAKTGKRGKSIPMREPNPALQGQWDTISFDECHNMVGRDGQTGIAATAAKNLADKASKVLYMSATPFTNITDMHYLTRLGNPNAEDPVDRMFGNSAEEFSNWAEYVGAVKSGNVVKNPPTWVPRVRVAAKLHVAGATVKRQASLEGARSKFQQVGMDKLSEQHRQVFDTADRIFTLGEQGLGETIMGMWRTNWAKSYWETLKIPAAIELGKQALAEGKQVALFTSYKAFNHAHLRKVPEKLHEIADKLEDKRPGAGQQMRHLAMEAQQLVDTLPPATDISTQLVQAFGGGDSVAEIHGNTTKKPGDEQKLYQEGRKRVAVCTQAKGGTGISLHDTSGERPRVQINLSLPWSGRLFDQVAGRSHRLGSKSETTIHWLMGDAETEKKMAGIVATRLRNQGSFCSGDPDIRQDAGMLAAWEASNASSESDDEGEDIQTLEDLTKALEQDDEEKVLGSEKLTDIRDAFAQYAQQLSEGRDLIGDAYRATQARKAHEAELAHARAAEQMRDGKKWYVVPHEHHGKAGYFLSSYPANLPADHPHYSEDRWRNQSSGFTRATSSQYIKPLGGQWVAHTYQEHGRDRVLMGYFVPRESMTKLAEELGVHKRKVDLREVMSRAKKEEAAQAERIKQQEAEEKAKFEASLAEMQPTSRKAVMALHAKTGGRLKVQHYGAYGGRTYYHMTEARPEDGSDSTTFKHREDIKALGGQFRDFPMHGGKGWMVHEEALASIADRILGGGDWRKSLVVPSMDMDLLLERCRSRMRMQRTQGPELIWCAEEVGDELEARTPRQPPGWPAELLSGMAKAVTLTVPGYHDLEKARTHKYIKRTPTGNVKRPWRYWYKLPSGEVVSSDDLQSGSRFKVTHMGQEGHFEVLNHDKDRGLVHVRHDESKREAHIRENDLKRMVQGYHAKKTSEANAAAGVKASPVLPRAQMGELGKGGYDEIHGFAANVEDLHRQAELMNKPGREFAVIKQPGGFVLASKDKNAGKVAEGTPEGDAAKKDVERHAARAEQIESKITVVRRDPVTGEETPITPKPTQTGAKEAQTAEVKPQKQTGEGAQSDAKETQTPAAEQRQTKLLMRAGGDEAGGKRIKAVPAEYVMMEAGDLVASHNPLSFDERADYPKGVQERRYHEVEADRTKIDEIARNLEPSLMVNSNPDAINGAPIITEDNIVLGGNGRTMGMQRAYAQYPEQAQQLRDYLTRHAQAFGYSSAEVAKMKHPVLVRRIKAGGDSKTLSALGRRMNESLTQGLDPRSAEVALGKHYVTREVMDSLMHHMDPDERLGDFLNSTKSKAFVEQLEKSGIIDQFNRGEFIDQETGLLNEDGRHRVERVLAARVIPDAGLLSRMNQKARESIAKAVPYLAQMEARGWDIRKSLELAVRADIEQRKANLYDAKDPKRARDEYLRGVEAEGMGSSGIRTKVNGDPVARAMFDVIQDHMGGRKFPMAMKQVALEADRQHHDHGDQGAMFQREQVTPEEAIRHAFKLPGPKKTTAPEEAEAGPAAPAGPKKLRRKKGESEEAFAQRVLDEAKRHKESTAAATPEAATAAPAATAAAETPEAPAAPEQPEEAPRGWASARREGAAAAAPAAESAAEREAREAREAEQFRREYDRARGRGGEEEPPPPPPEDTRTLGMFGLAMPATTWHKAEDVGSGLGRYVMHAVTWEAKNLVRAAVGAARPGEGIDGARVLKRLRQFIVEQTREDQTFARGIGAHPVNDATLRGLVQAAAQAHVSHLAKSLAVHSMWLSRRVTAAA